MRYRHTDSDLFRNARQQDFLRQAAQQPAVDELKSIGDAEDFARHDAQYFRFDKKFLSRRNLAGMLKTAFYLAIHHAPVNQISLRRASPSPRTRPADTRLYISNEHLRRPTTQFMTGGVDAQSRSARPRPGRSQEAGQEVVDASAAWRTPAGWARTWPSSPRGG